MCVEKKNHHQLRENISANIKALNKRMENILEIFVKTSTQFSILFKCDYGKTKIIFADFQTQLY